MSAAPVADDPDTPLAGWVDAAARGGFPLPARPDRWQPLRAGVVNLWEFEEPEYWFANGWAQLTGRNETGKSSLMALTTLIPWLADTSSANIDTLGRSGKRFRYYVEPSNADGDRRNAEASTHRGWLWVEYGRLLPEGPRYFTTLLFAEARSAAADLKLTWCTLEGADRVRESVPLSANRVVVTPREVQASGFLVHPTATAYREHVAGHLLSSPSERLEAIGKMLRVTRTPKLGAQLEIGFVQTHLRSALPELHRGEIDALADGWDQLDQIRADLASTKEAAEVLRRFEETAWLPWVRAVVRQRADAAGVARTEFDKVTRRETQAHAEVIQCEELQNRTDADAATAKQQAASARGAADELQSSARYRDAAGRVERLEGFRRQQADLRTRLAEATHDLAAAAEQVAGASADLERKEADHDAWAAEAEALRGRLSEAASSVLELPDGELDPVWLDQALRERDEAIRAALAASARAEQAGAEATTAAELAGSAHDQAERDADEADAAWAAAQAARDELAREVPVWATGLTPPVPADLLDAWLAGLPATEQDSGRLLRESVRLDWYEPARSGWVRAAERAATREAQARAEVERVDAEIAGLLAAPAPVFPQPVGWARRVRPEPSAAGAPLWSLLDPREGVPEAGLAQVEAALAAMSLLDAWVSADGVFRAERDGADVVVVAPAHVDGPNLGDLLQLADCDPTLAATVAGLLAGIALDQDGPGPDAAASGRAAAGLSIGQDGRWRTPGAQGRAAAEQATPEWLGASARANRRHRQFEELTAQKQSWLVRAEEADSERRHADAALTELAARFDSCPRDDTLRAALTQAADRDRRCEESSARAARAEATAREQQGRADELRADLIRRCTEQGFPAEGSALTQLRLDVGVAVSRLRLLEQHDRHRAAVAEARESARVRQRSAEEHHAGMRTRRDARADHLAEVDATVAALEATIGADDREILDELARLQQAERDAADEHTRLTTELGELRERFGKAKEQLANTEHERELARQVRDAAWAAFRVLLDRGLADDVGLPAADPAFAAAERVRDQIAIARRTIVPPRWPATPAEQDAYVERTRVELYKRANEEARIRLEAGGRSLQIELDQFNLPVVKVLVDSAGVALGPRDASARLVAIHDELDLAYSKRVQETLDELLGSTFLEHLRDRLGATRGLIDDINKVLAEHPVVTTKTSLKIALEPATSADATMLDAIGGSSLANPEVAGRVRDRLRARVEEAKRLAETQGEQDWRGRLAQQLDYRDWFEVQLKKRIGAEGRWSPLTTQGFAELSGGARAVILMLPLVATLAALYQNSEGCPRPLWLDEAFDGLDSANREMVMDLFGSFDLDVLLAGPARLVNVRSVPAAAIYQVVRAPAPLPGVDLTLELWAGGQLTEIPLPSSLPVGPPPEGVLV